jgi:hypothetical protein
MAKKKRAGKTRNVAARSKAKRSKTVAVRTQPRKKDPEKLKGRFALDFAAVRDEDTAQREMDPAGPAGAPAAPADQPPQKNPSLLRLKALMERDQREVMEAAVDATRANWTPMGPLAVPNGQTYGGARVLISGRVTAIAPHPTNGNTIFIGTSRGGVWRTTDNADTWTPLGDNQPSLAIGALGIGTSDPNVLYAGTGEGNVQYYSTNFALSSAPGVYLGIGVLRSADGGATWALHASQLLANHSFYRIAVDRTNANRAFAATSRGLCRTTDGTTWTALSGGGLPTISATVIACTDVVIDRSDATGNTVYAAFWGSGIYKSTNALAANPTFTLLTTGLPAGNTTSRISLTQSASSAERKYALIASNADAFLGLYRTTNAAGTNWELCTNNAVIELYGAFTSDVNVDPTTPDVVYVSGVELYKCVRNPATGTWSASNIGGNIHPDSHCFAFHPTLNQTIYSGNDGGFYVSRNGGSTWEDSPNEGLCLLQYEAIDNHNASDAIIQGGTQDNGTQQYRNSPVHYHSADGDGGYCAISRVNGNNMTHAYYGSSPRHSTTGGKFGSYSNVSSGLEGNGLFYPPAAVSPTSERMAWGTSVINFDDAMGTGGWPGSGVALPGIVGAVSAVSFTSDTIVYCATTSGQVYRLNRSGSTWTVRTLHAAPLPTNQWIWDVHSLPGDPNTIVVAFSGFGLAQHVWRGVVPATGTAAWTAVSTGLPDVPMYSLALDTATRWFVGTDIGVFRTGDAGANWTNYSQGLPNTAIYDLRLRAGGTLLRAATHGRGLWEVRTDVNVHPTVDVFVRDHIMNTGRPPSNAAEPAAWEDPTRYIALNDTCYWWHCADIKTDAPPNWQLQPGEVNYFNFETKLTHENPEKGNQNRVYVQVHNRGPLPADNVTVKIMTAGASAGLPDLPADFWTTWPNSAGDANWTPVGAPQTITRIDPLRPAVLQWNWTPGASADAHSCMLVVVDTPSDPIPASTKALFDIGQLVTSEKRVGLKNLHVVNVLADSLTPVRFHLFGSRAIRGPYVLRVPAPQNRTVMASWLFSKAMSRRIGTRLPDGVRAKRFAAADLERLKRFWLERELRSDSSWREFLDTYDTSQIFSVEARRGSVDLPLTIKEGSRETMVLLFGGGEGGGTGPLASLTLLQLGARKTIVGGSTFIFKSVNR